MHIPEEFESLSAMCISESRLCLLGYGIDLGVFSPSADRSRAARCLRIRLGIPFRTPTVGIVAPMLWEHGYREFFQAVKELRKRFSKDDLAFVVSGQTQNHIGGVDPATIDEMRSEFGVHFINSDQPLHGSSTNAEQAAILASFDLVVQPLHHDARPVTAMQASAMGLPVVATRSSSRSYVVDHKETGLLVRARRPQQLTLAIERLVRDPALRNTLGSAGRAKAVAAFDQRVVIDRTLRVYRELLEAQGIPVPDEPLWGGVPWYADSIDLVDRERNQQEAALRS